MKVTHARDGSGGLETVLVCFSKAFYAVASHRQIMAMPAIGCYGLFARMRP
jgi:hypothetical protein